MDEVDRSVVQDADSFDAATAWGPETRSSSCSLVLVDQTTEDGPARDAVCTMSERPWPLARTCGRTQPERPVRPVDVVVSDVLAQDALKVSSPQDHRPVEALAAGRAHPSFGVSVRVRRSYRGGDDPCSVRLAHRVEGGGELRVAVANEEARRESIWRRSPLRFRACCVTQALSGFFVTPARCSRRVFSSMKNKT